MQPVTAQHILAAAAGGGLVILAGAAYALLFALSRLLGRPMLMHWAWVAYVALVVGVALLAWTLNLGGGWLVLVALMLVGYLLAPFGIWHLCVGTHDHRDDRVEGQAHG